MPEKYVYLSFEFVGYYHNSVTIEWNSLCLYPNLINGLSV